jgi:pyruvate carboxylase
VAERTPLFVIEAMKMETSVNSIRTGKITKIHLKQASMVDQDDLILEIG